MATQTETEFEDYARAELLNDLVALRRASGLRQVDVAAAMGVGQPSVSELERGETSPKLSTLQRYARAIGAKIDFSVTEGGEKDGGGSGRDSAST